MNTIKDGGPAFPVSEDTARFPGISLRDYFAAKAMANMEPINSYQDLKKMPAWAYKIADAMLDAREATFHVEHAE